MSVSINLHNEMNVMAYSQNFDSILVKTVSGPMAYVDIIKSINIDSINDSGNLGQVFDQLKYLQTYHGRREVYAILTDLTHWRVLWINDESEQHFDDGNHRVLYWTPIIHYTDKNLAKVIFAVLHKSF
jgi:hypothetical protein